MKKKGVSPVIATVLLVGMVVALALIVFVWMSAFTKEAITKFDGENIELSCNKVEFQASYFGSQLSISNIGNVPIYDMRLKLVGRSGQTSKNLKDLQDWPSFGLNPGGSFVGDVAGVSGADDAILVPILLGESEKGKRVFSCDEELTGQSI